LELTVSVAIVTVLVTAAVSVGTTLIAVFYGPTWKDRVEARRASRQRSEALLARYSEPMARAAFDLQSRLYSISRKWFMTGSDTPDDYRKMSTLWLLGQFLGWIEIVRREVQVIDYGDIHRTAELQRHLFDVVDIFSTDSINDPALRVFRGEQRAIGELMVTERISGDSRHSDSMGYAAFVERFETDRAFARWFARWNDDLDVLMRGEQVGARLILTQRALINLIDFFDPGWVRFPDPNERGRIPLPSEYWDRKRLRPASEVARFRFETEPFSIADSWAREYGLSTKRDGNVTRVVLPRGFTRRPELVILYAAPWVEIHIAHQGRPMGEAGTQVDSGDTKIRRMWTKLGANQTKTLNALLRRFDRPTIPINRRRPWSQ
jgi:hypothetical protein